MEFGVIEKLRCYHCGDTCDEVLQEEGKYFCCEGCRQVYLLLNENNLCTYYDLSKNPGIKTKGRFQSGKFAYLDHESVIQKLVRFSDGHQSHVQFYLPSMHCASCIWLIENLHRIRPGIIGSRVNFHRKEVFIVYQPAAITLRGVVELLAYTGYEPYISLDNNDEKEPAKKNRLHLFRIGVAGFCFGNIMMLSFPEYFSGGKLGEEPLRTLFSYLNLLLSLPVLFFSAAPFFISAWQGLRQRWLNIDAPIALAILVTFARSIFEILGHSGAGYLDSMSGIVFFMLIGRWFQDKTYDSFSFDRDYKSYFPLGATRLEEGLEKNIPVTDLNKGDTILVRHEEMIPADAILRKGEAWIDYSFVTGENAAVQVRKGELVYAGGKQTGTVIELEVIAGVSRSYITQLWNNDIFHLEKNKQKSFIHPWSRYFTYALFGIALLTAVYWYEMDSSRIWPAVTAVLIIACPCSLLLSATFTYGNMMRIFGKNKMYLKNASVIETLNRVNTIVFDKTGTLTHHEQAVVRYEGQPLSKEEIQIVKAVTRQSSHPLSKIIAASLFTSENEKPLIVDQFNEIAGKGMEANVNMIEVKIGSASFVGKNNPFRISHDSGTQIHLQLKDEVKGIFTVKNTYRNDLPALVRALRRDGYDLHVLSGDNESEKTNILELMGKDCPVYFRQSPSDKMNYIRQLQNQGLQVLMLGDGLNDAGALKQSQVGVAVTDQSNLFSPASDAILDGNVLNRFSSLLRFAKSGKRIILASFILSILYNITGLYFATQALLSPVIAAILMPLSSVSIVLLVTISSNLSARRKGL